MLILQAHEFWQAPNFLCPGCFLSLAHRSFKVALLIL